MRTEGTGRAETAMEACPKGSQCGRQEPLDAWLLRPEGTCSLAGDLGLQRAWLSPRTKPILCAGPWPARRSSRRNAQSLAREPHQKQNASLQESPPGRAGPVNPEGSIAGGLAPTASGADSVASALGHRTRRDPNAAVRTYHGDPQPISKTGTFYFAGSRNFLLWSDRLGRSRDSTPPASRLR